MKLTIEVMITLYLLHALYKETKESITIYHTLNMKQDTILQICFLPIFIILISHFFILKNPNTFYSLLTILYSISVLVFLTVLPLRIYYKKLFVKK